MRSRPEIQVFLQPGVVAPGQRLVAETVLTSKSETPIEFVEMRLQGTLWAAIGAGQYRSVHREKLYDRVWRSKEGTLGEGEHRYRVEFQINDDAPPSYRGADAAISYDLHVHVSIPWWPDRRRAFVVPVKMPPFTPGRHPLSAVYATSTHGPRGDRPFMEVALDATDLALGDVVTGRISLANLRGKTVRGVDLSFVEMETVTRPGLAVRERGRFKLRVHEGAPVEGEAIPFRVRVPERATPSFTAGPIKVTTNLEVRAVLAWSEDIVVVAPLVIAPAQRADRDEGRVAPVGRERMLAVWRAQAARAGFVDDAEGDGMHGMRGAVRVRVTSDHRDGDYWLVAELAWPDLGLDLEISERKWSDALAFDVVKTGQADLDDRLAAHARENVQAQAFIVAFAPALLAFEESKVDDKGATLAKRGSVHAVENVDLFVANVLAVADAYAGAQTLVPPPAVLAAHVAAWRALADQLGGRLELGAMHIRDARIGTAIFDLGAAWDAGGLMSGFVIDVPVDPPLAEPPASPDAPSLSPAARDAWKTLLAATKHVVVRAGRVQVRVDGPVYDPAEKMPLVESAVTLRRALAGVTAAGPFR